jgi:small-conductance mechanosensitive channel
MTEAAVQTESAGLRTVMIVATIIGGLLLMLSAGLLAMSPMIFDSGESPTAWAVFSAIWAMPIILIAGLVIGWIGFARNARGIVGLGIALAGFPLVAGMGVLAMSGF